MGTVAVKVFVLNDFIGHLCFALVVEGSLSISVDTKRKHYCTVGFKAIWEKYLYFVIFYTVALHSCLSDNVTVDNTTLREPSLTERLVSVIMNY